MGYELHIHRAKVWHQSDREPITAEEWQALVAADPELARGPDGEPFHWADGAVAVKHPDRATLATMLAIAARLGARVQGDDGEFYTRPGDLPSDDEREAFLRRGRRWERVGELAWLVGGAAAAAVLVRRVWGA